MRKRKRCNFDRLNGRRVQQPHRSRLASAVAETHYCTDERLVQACSFLDDEPRHNQAHQEANHLVLCAFERHVFLSSTDNRRRSVLFASSKLFGTLISNSHHLWWSCMNMVHRFGLALAMAVVRQWSWQKRLKGNAYVRFVYSPARR